MKFRSSVYLSGSFFFTHARWQRQVIEAKEVEARKVGDRLDLDGC